MESLAEVLGVTAHASGVDPACRYRRVPEHLCINNRGEPVAPGGECFAETRTQVEEQGGLFRAAGRAV